MFGQPSVHPPAVEAIDLQPALLLHDVFVTVINERFGPLALRGSASSMRRSALLMIE